MAGEISAAPRVLANLNRDNGITELSPQFAVYPRTTNDVRKIARFVWRMAERGQIIPMTPRGAGASHNGSAIGDGILLNFPAHMGQILELDVKSRLVRVQPGLTLAALQEAMATHGLTLPVMPRDFRVSTVGGAIATNARGAKSLKYGTWQDWVERVEIVLANGEVVQTGRISARELNAKKGLQTLEGEIYRGVDALIDENREVIAKLGDAAPFNLSYVKEKNGSFDLTPLIIGSEGALGIVVQAILNLATRPSETGMIVAALDKKIDFADLISQLVELEPAEFEFIDGETLELIREKSGAAPWQKISEECPKYLIGIEFDDRISKKIKKAAKILDGFSVVDAKIATEYEEQQELRGSFASVAAIVNFTERGAAALPILDNIMVDPLQIEEFLHKALAILQKHHIEAAIWGGAGTGNVTIRPILNLANLGERQIVFKLMTEIYALAREFSGVNASANFAEIGRVLAPIYQENSSALARELMKKTKKIFDPFGTLNPGVKIGTSEADLLAILPKNYARDHFAEYNLAD